MKTIGEALRETEVILRQTGSPTPRLDAEVLLSHCLNTDRLHFFTHPEQILDDKILADYDKAAKRRQKGEPVSYIIGRKEFWSLFFHVNSAVLIPRPDTEIIVEETLAVMAEQPQDHWTILETGTGSGAIAIALAAEQKNAKITATDISEGALHVARQNARENNVADRILFIQGDMLAPLEGRRFDIIVSNPPYISSHDFPLLPEGIRHYEPHLALMAGNNGTEFHRRLIEGSLSCLNPGGWLIMEMGTGQGETIQEYFAAAKCYEAVNIRRDYAGMERVIKGRRIKHG
ncbi:MAG: peptide chain release factor N(5)-glutamine methyltransferase [Syntrophobacterales bacterium]|jgi:release factor glutamine methyltransferase|nr:peptide chain release factor N(5)-glutamine methyltransferase [Syntrophobacterales bacterium]